MFDYIGELCRYLLNAPPAPHERDHHIRAITGNGLRPEIWQRFQERFAIPRIVEFYGATEGNVSMLNYDGTVGAVGRVPDYMRMAAARPGWCASMSNTKCRCAGRTASASNARPTKRARRWAASPRAPGAISRAIPRQPTREKKILRDVFKKGDAWFRTGDLMRRDEHGYFYFVDRIGDTFRWKGENVATSEVAEALAAVPGIKEANVYGVSGAGRGRPRRHGGAGGGWRFRCRRAWRQRLEGQLAPYARPVFLRLQPEIEVTGTFKQRKVDLVRDGFDPSTIADPLYWFDPATGRYERLDAARYADIAEDRIKL